MFIFLKSGIFIQKKYSFFLRGCIAHPYGRGKLGGAEIKKMHEPYIHTGLGTEKGTKNVVQ